MREAAGASGVAAAAVIYGASGEWPKLSLVERVSVGPGEGDGPWTRIGKEVTERTIMHGQNISPSISSFLYVCSSLPLPPFLICVALPPSLSLLSLCVYVDGCVFITGHPSPGDQEVCKLLNWEQQK